MATNKDEEFHAAGHRSAFYTVGLIIKGIINLFRDQVLLVEIYNNVPNRCYRAWLNSFVRCRSLEKFIVQNDRHFYANVRAPNALEKHTMGSYQAALYRR